MLDHVLDWPWTRQEGYISTWITNTKGSSPMAYLTPATSCLTCIGIVQRYCSVLMLLLVVVSFRIAVVVSSFGACYFFVLFLALLIYRRVCVCMCVCLGGGGSVSM